MSAQRPFLTLAAWAAATAMVLSACAGAPAAPTAAPTTAPAKPVATTAPAAPAATAAPASKYKESPELAEQVKAGKLPAVDLRLPSDPLVVQPIEEIGQYGGTWRRAWKGPADFHAYGRLNYTSVIRWPRNPKDALLPDLASKWEFSPDGKELTLFFRKGLKWSDGKPWTVDDIVFWWEDIETNKDISPAIHTEFVVNGKPMTLQKIDDTTIKLKFDGPNGLILRMLAFHGNQWPLNFEKFGFFAPAHYLKQFHPKYTPGTDVKTFIAKADDLNPDRPVMSPWMVTQYKAGDAKLIAKRNPYYYKVDPQGQQLPYIDTVEMSLVENNDAVAAKALSCEIDMQFRSLDLRKFPLFSENAQKCGYRLFRWPSAQGTMLAFWPNQTYTADPVLRDIFRNKDFRMALSYAIDRSKINAVAYLDQGVPRSSLIVPDSTFYVPEVEKLYADFDQKKAAELLDKAGLKLGSDGKIRTRSDGKPLEIVIETERTGAEVDGIQLVAEAWTAVGVKTTVKTMTRDLFWPRATGNETQISVWSTDRGLEPFVDPIYLFPFDERSWMAPANGVWYKSGGQKGEKPEGKLAEAQQLYDKMRAELDPAKQVDIGKQIVKMATEEAWTISTVGMVPAPVVVKNNFRNVPEKYTQDWIIFAPGSIDPPQFFFKK